MGFLNGSMPVTVPILSGEAALAFEGSILRDEIAVAAAMERAGLALARAVRRDFAWWRPWPTGDRRLLVLAGKGHNAGDALIAARHLVDDDAGALVVVVLAAAPGDLKPLTARALEALTAALGERLSVVSAEDFVTSKESKGHFDVTLDGLVGAAVQGPLREPMASLVRTLREQGETLGFRVSVDLPSGLRAGGEGQDEAFVADVTYATGMVKEPVVARGAARVVGRLRFLDLGFFPSAQAPEAPATFLSRDVLHGVRRLRPALSDKRQYGRIYVLGGSRAYPGAVLMTCQAAVRAGAGLVTGIVPQIISNRLAVGAAEAMWMPLPIKPDGSFEIEGVRMIHNAIGDAGVLVIGPGLQTDRTNTFFISRVVRESRLPVILDASALNSDVIGAVHGRMLDAAPVIVTPHMGEYHRIASVKEDPTPEEVRAFAEKYRLTVILKGPVSLITDGKQITYAGAGNPVLARGGSGDLLAGILAARFAVHPDNAFLAACEAVTWHGEAADALARVRGEGGVKTTEILDFLSPALREFDR